MGGRVQCSRSERSQCECGCAENTRTGWKKGSRKGEWEGEGKADRGQEEEIEECTESKTRGVAGVIDGQGAAAGEPYQGRVGEDFALEIPVAATQENTRGQ